MMTPRPSCPTAGAPAPPVWAAAPAWIAALVGMMVFVNTLGNGFVYDDEIHVVENIRIRSLANLPAIFLTDWWQPQDAALAGRPVQRDRLYRPLATLSFALNYAAHQLDPRGYHAVNIALHALACALVWQLSRRLLEDARVATVAALLFAVHPLHAEAVANVVGRLELLAAVFLLAGTVTLLGRGSPSLLRTGAAAALYLLALLSKETAVCYLPIALVVVALRWRTGGGARAGWTRLAVLVLPLLVYFPLRYTALEGHLLRDRPPPALLNPLVAAEGANRLLLPLEVLGHYVRLTLWPAPLSADYGLAVIRPDRSDGALAALGAGAAAALLSTLLGWRARRLLPRQLALLATLVILSYVLVSNTLMLIGVSLAERLMYWPSVPVLMLLALLLTRGAERVWPEAHAAARTRRVARALVLGAVLLGMAWRAGVRGAQWRDGLTLFSADAAAWPASAQLNGQLGRYLFLAARDARDPAQQQALLKRAAQHLQIATRTFDTQDDWFSLLGRVLALLGDYPGAIAAFERTLALDPGDLDTAQMLAALRGR